MQYIIRRRLMPPAPAKRRKGILASPRTGAKQYPRTWEMLRDGRPIGFYESRDDAVAALPPGVAYEIADD